MPYAPSTFRGDRTRSINGLMPSSLEMAKDSSGRDTALVGSFSPLRSSSMSE